MIKSTSRKFLASFILANSCWVLAAGAHAEEVTVEGNVSVVSDYRFRGVSLSDQSIALQGGLDVSFGNGFYVGTWGSSIEPVGSAELELDIYGGFSGDLAEGLGFDIGVLAYTYPDASDTAYVEFYGSISSEVGDFGFAYAPEQDNIGSDDNLYVYYSGGADLGESGWSLGYGLGYETGAFGDVDGDGDDKIDWTLSLSKTYAGIDYGVAYIGTSEDIDGANDTVVFSIGRAF